MRSRELRALLVLTVLATVPAWALGCDDSNEKRTQAITLIRSANATEAAKGAVALEAILEKTPRDRFACYALASYYRRTGQTEKARHFYAQVIDVAPSSEEAEHAREEMAQLSKGGPIVAASASASASAAPLASIAIVPFRGIAPALVGSSAASAAAILGVCELVSPGPATSSTCRYFSRGIDVISENGTIARVELLREKRELFDVGTHHLYRGFVGATPEGVTPGMPEAAASAKLGEPASRRIPYGARVAEDGSIPIEVEDYPAKGFSLEIDLTRTGRVVGAIDIPTALALPKPTPKKDPKP